MLSHIYASSLGHNLSGPNVTTCRCLAPKPLPKSMLNERFALQWRHNERDGIWNRQPHDCLLNRLFRRRSRKTSKLRVTGLWVRNSPVNSPHKGPATRKMFPLDDVIMGPGGDDVGFRVLLAPPDHQRNGSADNKQSYCKQIKYSIDYIRNTHSTEYTR